MRSSINFYNQAGQEQSQDNTENQLFLPGQAVHEVNNNIEPPLPQSGNSAGSQVRDRPGITRLCNSANGTTSGRLSKFTVPDIPERERAESLDALVVWPKRPAAQVLLDEPLQWGQAEIGKMLGY